MTLRLFGIPESSYVWTARILLQEKQVPYDLSMAGATGLMDMHKSPDIDRHPFRKIPILEHDGRRIFEMTAICRYIDTVFGGRKCTPEDPYDAAMNDQWISVVASYVDRAVIRRLVLPSVIGRMTGKKPDADKLKRAAEDADHALGVLEPVFAAKNYFLGDTPMTADFFLWPILYYMKRLPAGARLLRKHTNVSGVLANAMTYPSFAATMPKAG
ncbi:MAG: glutathione S-transferase family protein [Alphaproteobacteria bacterium]|nr:glutathione S-transferase family protein [Alphaproteobacteria bacterium]MBO6861686.1 glutathione S-transferase family protein [Alphaproteobacteria bacterium]